MATLIVLTCQQCSKTFTPKRHGRIGLASKYCSVACRGLATRGAASHHYTRTERTCMQCGVTFTWIKSMPRKFCGLECRVFYWHGDKHPKWTGGRVKMANGYIIVNLGNGRRELEHRLVMSKALGRELSTNEIVHHLDGDKEHNVPENLVVMTASEHATLESRLFWSSPSSDHLRARDSNSSR